MEAIPQLSFILPRWLQFVSNWQKLTNTARQSKSVKLWLEADQNTIHEGRGLSNAASRIKFSTHTLLRTHSNHLLFSPDSFGVYVLTPCSSPPTYFRASLPSGSILLCNNNNGQNQKLTIDMEHCLVQSLYRSFSLSHRFSNRLSLPDSGPTSCIAPTPSGSGSWVIYHVQSCLGSSNRDHFQSLSLITDVSLLQSRGQLFCKMSPNINLFSSFLVFMLKSYLFGRKPQR